MSPKQPLIALIDPDPDTRRRVRAVTAALGAELEVFDTAEAFFATLAERPPACLIADSWLPGMPGVALLTELRRRGLGIPTILLSLPGDVPAAVSAMRAGALDCVEKPSIGATLAGQLAKVLDRNARPP